MVLVTGKRILTKANKGNYAIGAFNVNNLEIMQAIVRAGEKLKSPLFLQTSEGAIDYAGLDQLHAIITTAAKSTKIPIALHLDHGKDLDVIKNCIKIGYTSVMFDGSHYEFKKNVRLTKKIVGWAHKKGISVEAELGTIGGVEDKVSSREIILTEPDAAVDFAKRTGCDSLAIAIGTSHGAYKFGGAAKLDIARLKEINKRLKMPLVLHGASGVPSWLVKEAGKYGARLGKPSGVPDPQLMKAVKNGINKVNTDTDLRIAFDAGVRRFLKQKPKDFDPRHILGSARDMMQKVAEHRIRTCGSVRKA